MNISNKNLLMVSTAALLIVTPVLFLTGILRAGFPVAMACYALVLASLAIMLRSDNARLKKYSLEGLILIPVVYLILTPNIVLAEAIAIGGYEYFLNEMLFTYIYLIAAALLVLLSQIRG